MISSHTSPATKSTVPEWLSRMQVTDPDRQTTPSNPAVATVEFPAVEVLFATAELFAVEDATEVAELGSPSVLLLWLLLLLLLLLLLAAAAAAAAAALLLG